MRGHLALLVGVFVVALLVVALVEANLAGDAGDAAGQLARSDVPEARATRGLRASQLAERRALAGFLLTAGPADPAAAWLEQLAGPAAGSRPFTPEGQDAARYR